MANPLRSFVAGIVDAQGGVRVEINETIEGIMGCVGPSEHCYIIPYMKVQEPLEWEQVPALVETVHSHIAEVAWERLSSRTQALLRGLGRPAER